MFNSIQVLLLYIGVNNNNQINSIWKANSIFGLMLICIIRSTSLTLVDKDLHVSFSSLTLKQTIVFY